MTLIHAVLEISRAADLICSHLSQRDLSHSALVCRSWSRCFVPRLWRAFSIPWSSRLEALRQDPALLQALARHGHHVRSLCFQSLTDQDVINLAVPWLCRLTRLDLNLGEFSLFRPDSTRQNCTHCRHRHQYQPPQPPQQQPWPQLQQQTQGQNQHPRRSAHRHSGNSSVDPQRTKDPRHDFMFWPLQLTPTWTCRCAWPTASVATTTTTWDLDRLVTELYEQSMSRSMPTSPVAIRPSHGYGNDLLSPQFNNLSVSKSALAMTNNNNNKRHEASPTSFREQTTRVHQDRPRLISPSSAPLGPLKRLLEYNQSLTEIHFHEVLLHSVDSVTLIVSTFSAMSSLLSTPALEKVSIHSSTKSSEHGLIPFASIKAIVLALPSCLKELELEFTEEIGKDEDIEARSKTKTTSSSSHNSLNEDKDGWVMIPPISTSSYTGRALLSLQKLVYTDRLRTTPYDDCMPIHRVSRDRAHFLKFLVAQCPQLLEMTLNIVDDNAHTNNQNSLGAILSEACPLLQTLTLKGLDNHFSDDAVAHFISSLSPSTSVSASTSSSSSSLPSNVSLPSSPCSVHSFDSSWSTATFGTVTSIPASCTEDDLPSTLPPQIRTFSISSAHYVGPRTTSAIVNHLGESLEILRLDGCDRLRSVDLLRILKSCPRLRVLETPTYNSFGKSVEPCILNVADLVEEMRWTEASRLTSPLNPGSTSPKDPLNPPIEFMFLDHTSQRLPQQTKSPLRLEKEKEEEEEEEKEKEKEKLRMATTPFGWICSQTLTRLEICLEWLEPREYSGSMGSTAAAAAAAASATSLVRISGIEYLRYTNPTLQQTAKDESLSTPRPAISARRSSRMRVSQSSSSSSTMTARTTTTTTATTISSLSTTTTLRRSIPYIFTSASASNPLMKKADDGTAESKIWGMVYRQLGQLVQLQELILSDEPGFGACSSRETTLLKGHQRSRHWRPQGGITSRPLQLPNHFVKSTLEMTLLQGLDAMKGLKQIRVLDIERLSHRMGRPEVEWARENWPKLTVLRGRLVDGEEVFRNATWTWGSMTDQK